MEAGPIKKPWDEMTLEEKEEHLKWMQHQNWLLCHRTENESRRAERNAVRYEKKALQELARVQLKKLVDLGSDLLPPELAKAHEEWLKVRVEAAFLKMLGPG